MSWWNCNRASLNAVCSLRVRYWTMIETQDDSWWKLFNGDGWMMSSYGYMYNWKDISKIYLLTNEINDNKWKYNSVWLQGKWRKWQGGKKGQIDHYYSWRRLTCLFDLYAWICKLARSIAKWKTKLFRRVTLTRIRVFTPLNGVNTRIRVSVTLLNSFWRKVIMQRHESLSAVISPCIYNSCFGAEIGINYAP